MRNELYIGGLSVDTIEGLQINITKEVYSIVDPSKRKSDFTKTVDIPGSKQNDGIFASLFDVNFSIRNADQLNPDFNPSKKASCKYLQDSFVQIEGYCQLDDIVVLENNKVIYKIVIYGRSRSFFADIADLTLNDLTTLGTAVWDDAEIVDSWTATFDPTIKMVYPYVNRGKAEFWRGGPVGGNPVEWSYNYEAFKPWMYVKHLVSAIFHEAGYSLEVASFFQSEQFKKLILECDVKRFHQDDAAIAGTEVKANRSTNQTIAPVSNANINNLSLIWDKQVVFNIETSDPLSQYNTSTGTITVNSGAAGYCNIRTDFDFEVTFSSSQTADLRFAIMRKRAGAYTNLATQNISFTSPATGTPLSGRVINLSVDSQILQAGDELRVCLIGYTNGPVAFNNLISLFEVQANNNNYNFFIDGQILYGQTFDIASVLPNMKQTDFIMGIFKMFNIYIDTIYSDTGLIVEPRDEYFTDDIVDWTSKLDVSKDFTISPQGLLENKEILFTYTGNEDDLNKEFQTSTRYNYGYKRLLFDNEFVKDKREVKIPFALCPLKVDTDQGNINMITMFQGQGAERTGNPIIAYFGGMKSGNMVYFDVSGVRTAYTQYPYAGPLDDVVSPSFDLAFGRQDLYFYSTPGANGLTLTDNNLYYQNHQKQWQEIGNRDSKLVSGYFNLNADDIQSLSFRPQYWIDKAYYRLIEVQDYDPNGTSTTLCKFLKISEYALPTPTTTTTPGNGGQGGTGDNAGALWKDIKDGKLTDGNNKIDKNAHGVAVTGYGNSVGAGATNIIISGNNNTVLPGVQNVVIIGTDDLVIATSDQVYINGIKHEAGTTTEGYVQTYDSATNTIKLEAPTGGSGDSNIDGGTASSVYTPSQLVDGGGASG